MYIVLFTHTCTTIRALQSAVAGCGSKFEPFITTDLLQLIFTSLGHANRFVRETGFKVISAIVKCPGLSEATTTAHWPVVAENLARGLADNWSQVYSYTCTHTCMFNTVESWVHVSAHGRLNITREFGPHWHLSHVCIEAEHYIDIHTEQQIKQSICVSSVVISIKVS